MKMLHCVHIFVGKEYLNLLNHISAFAEHKDNFIEFNHFYNFFGDDKGNVFFQKINSEIDTIKSEELSNYWSNRIFDRILNVTTSANQDVLYVFIHVPLYKKTSLQLTKELCLSINKSARPVNVDFVGYCEDLFNIIEPNSKEKIDTAKQSLPFIKEMYSDLNYTTNQNNMIVIQNRTVNGISLLNEDDGVKPFYDMIANLSLLLSTHYDTIFSTINASSRDIVGIGFSSLSFDKYIYANYLLQKTMLKAIDGHNVNNHKVDVNKAKSRANDFLKSKENVLSNFLKDINANYNPDFSLLENEVDEIYKKILEYFNNDKDKDITTKAAVIAYLLSKTDSELFSSSFYDVNNNCYEDLYKESIDYFIHQDDVMYYKMINGKDEEEEPKNCIEELKDINRKLIQTETDIRGLEREIDEYEEQIDNNNKVKECLVNDDGYYTFDDKRFRLLPNVDEEPLTENYESHEVNIESVDLRSKFSKVKNQGQQGSCLSFALTSIFEYMMKVSKQDEYDLSEAFLYYNARHLDENENVTNDNGSRFHPSIKVLTQYGIALEKYCPYNDNIYDTKPSDEAYEDAAKRKLIKALNVKHDINDIKSALSDGYPVVGSFRLYPSFNSNGAYIPMPTQEEMQTSDDNTNDKCCHSRHAMTIVGFNDKIQMFLVRNSWGEDWGDRGYCYIPYSYIEDKNLFKFACIITEIASLDFKKLELKEVPALKIDNGDTIIKYYIAIVELKNKYEELKDFKSRRESLLIYIETQKKMYSDSNKRDEFVKINIANLNEKNDELGKDNEQKEKEKKGLLDGFKKTKLWTGIATVMLIIFAVLSFITIKQIWLSVILVVLIAIPLIIFFKKRKEWSVKTKEMQYEIERNKKLIVDNKNRVDVFGNKSFAAWKTIKSLYDNQIKLEQIYTKLYSLINNLRVWYEEIKNTTAEMQLNSKFPNISLLDKELIDSYFENTLCNTQVCNVDLCDDITNHQITSGYLSQYRYNLKNGLMSRLIDHLEGISFNVSDNIANGDFSDIVNIDKEMINRLQNQANTFLQIRSNERPTIIPDYILFAYNFNNLRDLLQNKFSVVRPSLDNNDDKYSVTLLSIVALSFDECVVFKA